MCGATHRLCNSQQSPHVHPATPATTAPSWRMKMANSTSSPMPIASVASRRIWVSRNSTSPGSGCSSTVKVVRAAASITEDLLDEGQVVEVGPVRTDLSVAEIGHRDTHELDVTIRRVQYRVFA